MAHPQNKYERKLIEKKKSDRLQKEKRYEGKDDKDLDALQTEPSG